MQPAPGAADVTARPVLFEDAGGGTFVRCTAGRGSGVLAVVFSQVRVPEGRFGLSRLFDGTRHPALFVNQPDGRWYRDSADVVDAALARAVGATGAARVIFYGSSMGGYGALAAAARHPQAEAIAFAPDFRIGEAASRSAEAGLEPVAGEPSLADLLAARDPARTDVVIGLFDPYDAGVAARLADVGRPGRSVIPVRSGHEVHDHLYTVNVIRRIIGTFDRGVAPSIAERGLIHPPVPAGTLAAFAALGAALEAGEPVDPGRIRGLGLAGNPGAVVLEATALEAGGDVAAADVVLARLWREVPADPALSSLPTRYLKRIPLARMRLLGLLGRDNEAEAVRREAAARFPTDPRFGGGSS